MSNHDFTFNITRTFNAPRSLVWKAWTDKGMAAQWFGPKGCTITYKRFNVEAGGEASYSMEFNGMVMHGRWSYLEVDAPSKLVSVVAFTDAEGNIIEHPGMAGWPKEIYSVVTFAEKGDKTEIRVQWKAHNASALEAKTFADNHPSMEQGWGGSFEQLDAFLAKEQKGKAA